MNDDSTKKIGVLVSGNGSNLQAIIDACNSNVINAKVVCVISSNAKAFALQRAADAGIDFYTISNRDYADTTERDNAMSDILRNHNVNCVCLAGYMRLVGDDFVKYWWNKLINIHPRLDTHARALTAGVKFTGCTVHFVRTEMDTGPIINQAITPIFADDTEDSIKQRVHKLEHHCYVQALQYYCNDQLNVVGDRVFIVNGK